MGTADMPCPWLQAYSGVTLGSLADNPPSGEEADAAKPT